MQEAAGSTLGLIGAAANGQHGPVRVASFKEFQRMLGEIDTAAPGRYPAGHAAAAAFMNGIERVAFAGVDDIEDGDGLVAAFRRLIGLGPLQVVAAPGALDSAPQLAAAFLEWESSERRARRLAPGDVCLWLDAPDRATIEALAERQRSVSTDPERVRVAVPWVQAISPGRRSAERIPASAVIAPLYLGTATELRGAYDVDSLGGPLEVEPLREAGCGLLTMSTGRGRRVRLAFPPPRRGPPAPEPPATLENRIREAVDESVAELLTTMSRGPMLYRAAERNAKAVLNRFKQSGEISDFRLRCDAETNEHAVGGLAMEIWVKTPVRVRELFIKVHRG